MEETEKKLSELYEKEFEKGLKKLTRYRTPAVRAIILEDLYRIARSDPKKIDTLRGIVEKDIYLRDEDRDLLLEKLERAKSKLEYVI
jgi:hypothetical protein